MFIMIYVYSHINIYFEKAGMREDVEPFSFGKVLGATPETPTGRGALPIPNA
jgi:hypothetical protein